MHPEDSGGLMPADPVLLPHCDQRDSVNSESEEEVC